MKAEEEEEGEENKRSMVSMIDKEEGGKKNQGKLGLEGGRCVHWRSFWNVRLGCRHLKQLTIDISKKKSVINALFRGDQ